MALFGMTVLPWTNYKVSKQGNKTGGYKHKKKEVEKAKGYGFGGG